MDQMLTSSGQFTDTRGRFLPWVWVALCVAVLAVIYTYVGEPSAAINRLLHLHEFAVWLTRTPARAWVHGIFTGAEYSMPVVQWIHILGICTIVGTVGFISLRMMGLFTFSPPLADMARRMLPWAWIAIATNVTTGTFMVIDRPTRSFDSTSFPYKILFLIVGTALTITFAVTLRRDPNYWERTAARQTTARIIGALSLFLWIGVIAAGRWIYYAKAPL